MKKLMAILAALLVVAPATVKADTWFTYTAGQEVNFYTHKDDEVGKTSIILDDEGGEAQYVKAWFVGIQGTTSEVYADPNLGESVDAFEKTGASAAPYGQRPSGGAECAVWL